MDEAYSRRFDEAVAFTLDAFRGKFRKSHRTPYVTHLFGVTALVGEHGGDEDQLIAAMLHDYLEDIEGASAALLEERFGARVRRMVEGLSDSVGRPRPPWKERKLRYIEHIGESAHDVRLVAAADKLHNCRTILVDRRHVGDAVFDRFTAGREGTVWYYLAVAEAIGKGWSHPIQAELAATVAKLERSPNR